MDSLINIISIVGPLIFAVCIFALKNISTGMKIGLWIICALILIFDLYLIIKDKKNKEEKSKREGLYNRLYERQELFDRNLPGTATDALERNPLLKKSFRSGQKKKIKLLLIFLSATVIISYLNLIKRKNILRNH